MRVSHERLTLLPNIENNGVFHFALQKAGFVVSLIIVAGYNTRKRRNEKMVWAMNFIKNCEKIIGRVLMMFPIYSESQSESS